MSDEIKLRRGGTHDLTLRRKKRAPRPPGTLDEEQGIIPLADEGPRYVRRGGLSLTFYDLGTRLRSVPEDSGLDPAKFRAASDADSPAPGDGLMNEYVEQEFAGPLRHANVIGGVAAGAYHTAEDQQALDLALLAAQPGASFPDQNRVSGYLSYAPAHVVHAGTLVGVVVKGDRRFYVWQDAARARRGYAAARVSEVGRCEGLPQSGRAALDGEAGLALHGRRFHRRARLQRRGNLPGLVS